MTYPSAFHIPSLLIRKCGLILPIILSACATEAELLADNALPAVYATESRARQELNCPEVTAFILTKAVVPTETVGWCNKQAEYTIGTRGCDKQAVFFTLCRDPKHCLTQTKTERKSGVSQKIRSKKSKVN